MPIHKCSPQLKWANLLLIIPFFFLCCSTSSAQEADSLVFKKLYLLHGKWTMKTKTGTVVEEWRKINNHQLEGVGFFVKNNDTIVSEKLALNLNSAGIFYISTVEKQNNKQPILFTLTTYKNTAFIFENIQHDYPKRIVYNLISSDSLNAFIDNGVDDTKRRQYFFYKKIK